MNSRKNSGSKNQNYVLRSYSEFVNNNNVKMLSSSRESSQKSNGNAGKNSLSNITTVVNTLQSNAGHIGDVSRDKTPMRNLNS